MREPSVTFAITENYGKYLIVNLPDDEDTHVLHLDPQRGYPSYKGIFGHDLFNSTKEEQSYLRQINSPGKICFLQLLYGCWSFSNW